MMTTKQHVSTNVLCRIEASAIEQLNEWLLNDYGLRLVFEFTLRGDELIAGIYKTNGDGGRYLVCERCGERKNDDMCVGSKMIAATDSVRLPLTSRPPLPVISAWVEPVKRNGWS
jgi:hypothetical protein